MMKFIDTYKWYLLAGLGLILVYLFLRMFHIMNLPMFTDEAIYVRWAQIAHLDPAQKFVSLQDGKQPLFIWLTMFLMRFFKDPLVAGRVVSVFAGLSSMIGMFCVGRELFKSEKVGVVAALLYLVYPMSLVYDRMALYESLVSMFTIWILYLEILLVRRIRLDIALILGLVMGGGFLTKSNVFLTIPVLIFALFLFDFKQKHWQKSLILWACFAILATVLGYGIYSILRLSPLYYIINLKTATFAYPVREWIKHPLLYLVSNLRGMFDWFITYFSVPWGLLVLSSFIKPGKRIQEYLKTLTLFFIPFGIILLALFSIGNVMHAKDFFPEMLPWACFLFTVVLVIYGFVTNRERLGEKLLLLMWFFTPFLYLATFGRTLYPRYVLNMSLPLVILAAYGLVQLVSFTKQRGIIALLIVVFVLLQIRADYFIITDFARAPIPSADLNQYSNDWPAGGGYKQVVSYLLDQSTRHTIYVASEGTFGSLPTYMVQIYMGYNPHVQAEGIWPLPEQIPADLLTRAKTMPVYMILNQSQPADPQFPRNWPMHLIAQYQKGTGTAYMRLYRVE